jgi:8-oxo-dGTP pyrophosphatase MutT (NUDIX family)
MPGGKLEEGEDNISALIREVWEELGVELEPSSIQLYGEFTEQAYAKPEGVHVKIICYTGLHKGDPYPNNEIEKIQYFSHSEYTNMPEVAPVVKLIVDDLKKQGLIE